MNRIAKFLQERGIEHELISHEPTYDAQRLAEAVATSGHLVAKTVLLKSDVDYLLAVVPASCRINHDAVKHAVMANRIELATEEEIANTFNDCEKGVIPPFGSQYGMLSLLDSALAEAELLVCEGTRHDEAIRMKMSDYIAAENPMIGEYSLPALNE